MSFLADLRKKTTVLNEAKGDDPKLGDDDFKMDDPTEGDDLKVTEPEKNPEDTTIDDFPDVDPTDKVVPGDEKDPADDGAGDNPDDDTSTDPPADDESTDPPADDGGDDSAPKPKQNRILSLSDVDRELNNIKLADRFSSLQTTIGTIYNKLKDRVTLETEEDKIAIYRKALENMSDLRDNFTIYFTHKYMINSYEDNLEYYAIAISAISGITMVLLGEKEEQVEPKKEDNNG